MKLYVWDLHGVLECGTDEAVKKITNYALARSGYDRRMTDNDMEHLFGMAWADYFPYLLPDESSEKHKRIYSECRKIRNLWHFRNVRSASGARHVLREISRANSQIVMSNVSRPELNAYLFYLGMKKFFPGEKAIAALGHKRDALARFLSGRNYEKIVIIGDSPSDMELKSVAGGVTFLYANPGRPFSDCAADYKIRDLGDVLLE